MFDDALIYHWSGEMASFFVYVLVLPCLGGGMVSVIVLVRRSVLC